MRIKKKTFFGAAIALCVVLLLANICAHKGIYSTYDLYCFLLNRYSECSMVDDYLQKKYPIDKKFWLHRTNTPVKLTTKGTRYAGVELDITYYSDEDDFDNSHDLADGIEWPLDNMFAILGESEQKIWLDYKNLSVENAEKSRKKLESLLAAHGIVKDRCIVESSNYEQLKEFHDHGFYTSFYVPTTYARKKAEIPVSEEKFKEILRTVAASGNIDAVSFPYEFYERIKETGINTDMLCWDNNSKWWEFYTEPRRNTIFNDDMVKVILIKDKSTEEH